MAPRRARRATPGQTARNIARAQARGAEELAANIRKATARGIQEFAVRSMNELAQAGPAWTGEFSASWGFAPEGVTPNTPGTTGKVYRYTKNDVPLRDVERYVKNGVDRFSIVNTAPHAAIAIDEEKARFFPVGEPVKQQEFGDGRDQPSLRYEIGDTFSGTDNEAPASRTAEEDWFTTYVLGGGLQKDLSAGFSFGFSEGS